MKTAIRPIDRSMHVFVMHWIEMNVMDMIAEILVIPDAMLPKSSLPNRLFLFMLPTGKHGGALVGRNAGGKRPLDVAPSRGIIGISFR